MFHKVHRRNHFSLAKSRWMLVERGEDVVPVTVLGVRYWNAGLVTKAVLKWKGWILARKHTYLHKIGSVPPLQPCVR